MLATGSAFGRAVRREDFDTFAEAVGRSARSHRRGRHPAEMTRFTVGNRGGIASPQNAVSVRGSAADPASSTRSMPQTPSARITAGEPNRFVTPNCSICATAFRGSILAGRVGFMSGTTHVMPSAGPNRANSGNVQKIDFAGLDAVDLLQHFDLRGEDAVRVDDPLGDAGAAAGEEDRGRLVGVTAGDWNSSPSRLTRSPAEGEGTSSSVHRDRRTATGRRSRWCESFLCPSRTAAGRGGLSRCR